MILCAWRIAYFLSIVEFAMHRYRYNKEKHAVLEKWAEILTEIVEAENRRFARASKSIKPESVSDPASGSRQVRRPSEPLRPRIPS